jgi:hypothetical protein
MKMKPILFYSLLLLSIFYSCESETTEKATSVQSAVQDSSSVSEPPAPKHAEDAFLIKDNTFMGISPGNKISEVSTRIEKALVGNGEGEFEAYLIFTSEGEQVGYFLPSYLDPQLVGPIIIKYKSAHTSGGLKYGMSFGDVIQIIDDFEVHGSEIESRVHIFYNDLIFRLDHASTKVDLDIEEVPKDSRIIEIQIQEPHLRMADENGYYICYQENDRPSLQFAAYFIEPGIAQTVSYKGQTESIELIFTEKEIIEAGRAPYIMKYNEIIDGQVNGQYEFTHSGNWDYAKYTRKDGKVFNFTFMAEKSYQEDPCF